MWADIIAGIAMSLTFSSLLAGAGGVALGIIFGALPGLTATMGVALLLPLTFSMTATAAFSAMLGMYVGAIYGGVITAILVGTPGTVAQVATVLEGPALTAKGESKKALELSTWASFIGGMFSCIVLVTLAPMLAKVATAFGAAEYFAVAVFAMAVVATLTSKAIIKGGIAALIGCFLSTIGSDPISGELRSTFGFIQLFSGLPLVSVLIGLFAVGQIALTMEKFFANPIEMGVAPISRTGLSFKELWGFRIPLLRSSIIGTIIGIIPATGVGTAAFLAYADAKGRSKNPEQYGKGCLEGISATESANSAVIGGGLIPTLTLGIPGDIVMAIMLGALMIQGLVPGPLLFQQHTVVVYSIFSALIVANLFMLFMGLFSIRWMAKILLVPTGVLMPAVIALCVVGGYAINNSTFDLIIVGIFGVVGYLLLKIEIPQAPLLLSMILTPIAETNFRRALVISDGSYGIFFTSPISAFLLALAAFVIIRMALKEIRINKQVSG